MNDTISATLVRSVLILGLAAFVALPSVAVEADIPRMADGKPDLSGFYNIATLTPLQRPEKYGDNLFLTAEEAKAIEEEEQALLAKANEKSDPNRAAPSDTGAAPVGFDDSQRENLGAGNVGGYNAFWIDRGSSAVSIDGAYRTSINLRAGERPDAADHRRGQGTPRRPPGADAVPRQQGRRVVDTGRRCRRAGSLRRHRATAACRTLHHGLRLDPRAADAAGALQQPQADRSDRHPRDDPGRDEPRCPSDAPELRARRPERPQVAGGLDRLVGRRHPGCQHEALRRPAGPEFCVTGPARHRALHTASARTRSTTSSPSRIRPPGLSPWKGDYVWPQTSDKVYEYACHEGNYAMGNIMRGARLLEAEALAARCRDRRRRVGRGHPSGPLGARVF